MEKVVNYAFIDSQNLNLGTRADGWTLDFKKFFVLLKDKFRVEKAYLFIGHVPGNEYLYTALQEYGYILVFKPTLEIKKGDKTIVKGNVDAELVLHSVDKINQYSGAVVVSGDGDFHCLYEYLVEKGKLFKIIVPNKRGFSSLLRKFSAYLYFLDKNKEKMKKGNTSTKEHNQKMKKASINPKGRTT